jgi:hypothetical protein
VECPVTFQAHFVGPLVNAYQCSVADLNGDGKPDILALSSARSEVVWFESPTWKRHVITTVSRGNIDLAAYDLDRNGKPVVALASEFDLNGDGGGGRLQLFRQASDPTAEWVGTDFGRIPAAHRIRCVDWDGDGKRELVVVPIVGPGALPPSYHGGAPITSYSFRNGAATARIVDRSLDVVHGVRVLDYAGNGREALLTASLEGVSLITTRGRGAGRTWTRTRLAAGEQELAAQRRGSSEVDRGWLAPKRSFLATIEPWHGNEVVVYTPPKRAGELWDRHVIDDTLVDGHALACVDLDGDGRSEIVAGYRGGGHDLIGYRCTDAAGTKWERFTIDAGGMGAAGLVVADLTGSGRPGLVASGSATNNVKWYENLRNAGRK